MRNFGILSAALVFLAACSEPAQDSPTLPDRSAATLAFDFRTPATGEGRCRFLIHPNYLDVPTSPPVPESGWTAYVDGPCRYSFLAPVADSPDDAGTLILTELGPATRANSAGDIVRGYFVYLNFRDSGFVTADGSWNADRQSGHAHAPLGSSPDNPLRRDGSCWVNDRARLCLER